MPDPRPPTAQFAATRCATASSPCPTAKTGSQPQGGTSHLVTLVQPQQTAQAKKTQRAQMVGLGYIAEGSPTRWHFCAIDAEANAPVHCTSAIPIDSTALSNKTVWKQSRPLIAPTRTFYQFSPGNQCHNPNEGVQHHHHYVTPEKLAPEQELQRNCTYSEYYCYTKLRGDCTSARVINAQPK